MTQHLHGRIRAACTGQPATIAWPHRLLHEAADAIEATVWKTIDDLEEGVRAVVAVRNDNTGTVKQAILYRDEHGFRVDDDNSQINDWNFTPLCWHALQPVPEEFL